MLAALMLVGFAVAAPFRFRTSEGASVEVLPQVEPGRTELVVYDNGEDILAQLGREARPGVRSWRVSDLGEVDVVTLWLTNPADAATLRRDGNEWTAVVTSNGRTAVPSHGSGPCRSIPQLMSATPAAGVCEARKPLALTPLQGDDMMHALRGADFTPALPRWTAAEPAVAAWDRLRELQEDLLLARAPGARALRTYAIAATWRDLGHDREAAYYFGRADALGAPSGTSMLQRAGALLRVRDLPGARNAALSALERGAPEDAVLEVLGITELLEPTTAAAPLALALASSTAHPQAQLIAGTLLLRAGCAGDALPVLRRAASRGDGRRLPPDRSLIATLLLADALLLSGEVEGASDVLATLDDRPLPPRWSGLFHARSRLLAILRRSPDEWPTFVPSMRAAADRWDEEGAESLWLLGQMSETLGDVHRAHDAFLELIDRHEPFAHGAPGRRLLATWQNRVFALLERGEDIEALSVHRATWRRSLHAQMTDPGLLRRVAATYSKFGLHDDALDVLADAAAVEGALGLDEKATALDIADTYRRAGRHTEALEALDFVMTKRPSPDEVRTARFIEARAHLDAGRESAALDVLRPLARPNTPGPTRAAAQAWIAVVDARNERCEAALPYLLPATLPDGVDPGVLGLLRSRCLRNLGRDDEARAAAAAARPLLDDAELRSWAGFLGSVGVPTALPAPEPGQRTARAWDRLAAEEAEWTALREKLGAREENP